MKNKITAAILAIFLGSFGVHRFYLGQAGLGILHLIFCWTFISGVIGIIDGIVFLLMGEDSFNLKYNRAFMPMSAAQPTIVIQNVQGDINHQQPPSTSNNSSTSIVASSSKDTPFKISGDKKYADYDFDGAIADYKKSLSIKPTDYDVHFRLACLYSILEQVNNSLFHLNKAVEQGFVDFDQIKQHDHLAYLRSTSDFDRFVRNNYRIDISESSVRELPGEAIISQIEKLAQLKDKGAISEEEFTTQKSKLLAS